MFLKRCARKKNGKPHTYWQLVESYRTPRGPRHRVVAYLGELGASEHRGWGRLALHLDGKAAVKAQQLMLVDGGKEFLSATILSTANKYQLQTTPNKKQSERVRVRHTKLPLQCNFYREAYFGAAVIRLPSGSYA